MKRVLIFCLILLTSQAFAQNKQNADFVKYINEYKDVAIKQMREYRIPASITLAQGLLESGAGNSELARRSNNHFGIKCGSSWKGKTVKHDDDRRNECFRVYKSVEESYKDHSLFLQKPRYQSLFKLDPQDYKSWARGLKACGYATSPVYANRLIDIIETYELYMLDEDRHGLTRRPQYKEVKLSVHVIESNNNTMCIRAKEGDTWKSLSKEFSMSQRKLLKYNDAIESIVILPGDIIYLEKKQKKASKVYKKNFWHKVRHGESMYSISQLYGIRLKNLYKLNYMSINDVIGEGELLKIR
jgi:LysM repeat protein